MADSIMKTAVGAGNIEPKRLAVDMSETIARLQPSATPLVVLTGKTGKEPSHNVKFEWMDNDLEGRWAAVQGTANLNATTINVKAGTGKLFKVGDLVKIIKNGEVIRVTGIATDALTVVRNLGNGATSAVALADNDQLLILGDASMQGSGAPAEKVVGVIPAFNYTQIFKTPFSVTGTLEAIKKHGGSEKARLRFEAALSHAKSIEYAFLFGVKSQETSGAQPITTTEGVLTRLMKDGPNNMTSTKATMTYGKMVSFCEKLFQHKGGSRTCLCSADVLSWFAENAMKELQIVQSDMDKTYGLDIVKVLTPHGVLNLVLHPLLTNGYAGHMVALDLEQIKQRPLAGRDTTLKTNVQLSDEDGERDMFITETGVQLRLPALHGVFTLTN